MNKNLLAIIFCTLSAIVLSAQSVEVGKASYTTTFPGKDEAGRNSYPVGTPRVTGNVKDRPAPTNDWWSNQLYSDHASNLFNYPLAMRTTDNGLVIVKNFQQQGVTADRPIEVMVEGISSSVTHVSDYSDWTVTFRWGDDNNYMDATTGIGMPFVYFEKQSSNNVRIDIGMGSITIVNEMVIVSNSYNKANYAIYAPQGSTWQKEGTTVISSLNGKDYWSVALLPDNADATTVAKEWGKYAYSFPTNTQATWSYDKQAGVVTTFYSVTTETKEGNGATLMGLLPHHRSHIEDGSINFIPYSYATVRGELKLAETTGFTTQLAFHGILPTLPAIESSATGFSSNELTSLVDAVVDDNGLSTWTDSYNDGQLLNRLVQTARIAHEHGYKTGFDKAFKLIKDHVENWLTYTPGEIAFLFYYHDAWNTLIGYPAGHYQDGLINDHHFHWGYFIHAAAFIAQHEPSWIEDYGEMINLLIRDAASTDRNDTMFPYQRSFSPYAGHCWANGMASLGLGNDQESSSESMQFHSSLIHWGSVTNNSDIRDLGIYMYVTEQTAIEEYWFDAHNRNFPENYGYEIVSRVFTNGYDTDNFWGGGIAGSLGIELYPIHAGSFYLMQEPDFAARYWQEIENKTGILSHEVNPNLWHDVMYQFLSMMDASKAIELYNNNTKRNLKFGISQAQTYQWIHAMAQLGKFNNTITANHPLAMAFDKDGVITYVAQNYAEKPLEVVFSDGFSMNVPAHTLYTETGVSTKPTVYITSPDNNITIGTENTLFIQAEASIGGNHKISYVEFFANGVLLGSDATAPYESEWTPAQVGTYQLTAQAYTDAGESATSQSVVVNVTTGGADDDNDDDNDNDNFCTEISDEATQGAFTDGYTMQFRTKNNAVEIRCTLHDEKEDLYAYLWDYTTGFAEKNMTVVEGKTFTETLTGYPHSTTVRFAVKFAYRGGMCVTKIFEYTVGTDCFTEITSINSPQPVKIYPNPAKNYLKMSLPTTATVLLWNTAGEFITQQQVAPNTILDISKYPTGTYIVKIVSEQGNYVTRIVINREN